MIIIESVKERLDKHKGTLAMIKECLWLTKITTRIKWVKRRTAKSWLF